MAAGHRQRRQGLTRPHRWLRGDGSERLEPPPPRPGALAQLVAHLLCKQGVRGSSPLGSTTRNRRSACGFPSILGTTGWFGSSLVCQIYARSAVGLSAAITTISVTDGDHEGTARQPGRCGWNPTRRSSWTWNGVVSPVSGSTAWGGDVDGYGRVRGVGRVPVSPRLNAALDDLAARSEVTAAWLTSWDREMRGGACSFPEATGRSSPVPSHSQAARLRRGAPGPNARRREGMPNAVLRTVEGYPAATATVTRTLATSRRRLSGSGTSGLPSREWPTDHRPSDRHQCSARSSRGEGRRRHVRARRSAPRAPGRTSASPNWRPRQRLDPGAGLGGQHRPKELDILVVVAE